MTFSYLQLEQIIRESIADEIDFDGRSREEIDFINREFPGEELREFYFFLEQDLLINPMDKRHMQAYNNFVRTKKAILKYGFYRYEKMINKIVHWIDGFQAPNLLGSGLQENIDLLQEIVPMPKIPDILYRGMSNLRNTPSSKGEDVFYTNKVGKFISMTENYMMARSFAKTDTSSVPKLYGIVLYFSSKDVKKDDIILYPLYGKDSELRFIFEQRGGYYTTEREWVVAVKEPIKVMKYDVINKISRRKGK